MKLYTGIVSGVAAALLFAGTLSAQPQTKEEWQKAMQSTTAKRDSLKKVVTDLETTLTDLKAKDAAKAQELAALRQQLLDALGKDEAALKEFLAGLDRIDAYLDELSRLSNQQLWERKAELDSVQNMINRAMESKAARIPANKQRLDGQQQRLDALKQTVATMKPPEQTYTVGTWARDRDCLWNIAKKPAIYDNPFLWPKIWAGNRDQIRNPDIIHPGQVLKVPQKAELTREENRMVNSYWAKKRQAQPAAAPAKP